MDDPLDRRYFRWLYEQVAEPEFEEQDLTYWKVLRILFTTEFHWLVANDENRVKDGTDLRDKFLSESGIDPADVDPLWMETECSVLEVMVGLSIRLEFVASEGKAHYWFWMHLMENLGFSGYNDSKRFTRRVVERIQDILDALVNRTYEMSGLGGFFPLQLTENDQRHQEIWSQMGEYLLERGLAW